MDEANSIDAIVSPIEPGIELPAVGITSSRTQTVTTGPTSAGWLSSNLRNIIALSLTGVVVYLAVMGNHDANIALVASFSVLMGAIWGERAALKQPGKDS
jgi:hypothetical protein